MRCSRQVAVSIFILSNQPMIKETNEIVVRSVKLSYDIALAISCLILCGFCKTLFYVYNSFFSSTRCNTVGHSKADRPSAGFFGPGHRCWRRGGVLLCACLSSARRSWSLWYSFPDGSRKRAKIGDRGTETRRFRSYYLCIFLVLFDLLLFHSGVSCLRWLSCLCFLTHSLQ